MRQLDSIELNKRFVLSFLHVLGKLITKTGMESFAPCAIQMLREFRLLIQHSPIPVTSHRMLQLVSLNMFSIEITKLKGKCASLSLCIIIAIASSKKKKKRILAINQSSVVHRHQPANGNVL